MCCVCTLFSLRCMERDCCALRTTEHTFPLSCGHLAPLFGPLSCGLFGPKTADLKADLAMFLSTPSMAIFGKGLTDFHHALDPYGYTIVLMG